MRSMLPVLLCALSAQATWQPVHCQRGASCWPSSSNLEWLRQKLSPEMERSLVTESGGPYAGPHLWYVATLSTAENAQPLYGLGLTAIEPLYSRENLTSTCEDRHLYESGFCKATVTNVYDSVDVDFVVFPLTAEHVQTTVRFAKKHNLCVVVAGTGHEFAGRNQPLHCTGGSILIRTLLMKSKEQDFADEAGLGHPSFRFGAGNTFSEIHNYTYGSGKMVPSGLCPSVGIVGWSLGGGHGPYSPALGLGADQLLAVDIVLASGDHVRATADNQYSDLFRALKGGAGSTWGVITHVVIKAHDLPADGFTLTIGYLGTTVSDSDAIHTFAEVMLNFSTVATANISSSVLHVGKAPYFSGIAYGLSRGDATTPEAVAYADAITRAGAIVASVKVIPEPWNLTSVNISDNAVIAWERQHHATALLTADDLPALVDHIDAAMANCTDYCVEVWLSDLTGHIGSPQQSFNSLSDELRTALGMYMSTTTSEEDAEAALGVKRVYISESYSDLPMSRYWDETTYIRLLQTKMEYDEDNVFGCRNCIGDYNYY